MKETLNQVATYLLFPLSIMLTLTNPGISLCLFGLALAIIASTYYPSKLP